jgi:hypothetical protein
MVVPKVAGISPFDFLDHRIVKVTVQESENGLAPFRTTIPLENPLPLHWGQWGQWGQIKTFHILKPL